MSKGITFDTKEDANEYADNIREQGLIANIGKDKKTGKFLVGIKSPKVQPQIVEIGEKKDAGRGIFKGIGQFLAPSKGEKPKIAQIATRRRDMGIAQTTNSEYMKAPGLRGRDIRGRRIKRVP